MSQQKFARKKLFVNPRVQGMTIGLVLFYWGVYHIILWHVMFLYRYFEYRGELMAGAAPQTFKDLYGQFTLSHFSVIVCALAILPIVVWDVLKLTHKFVGPLVRFKHVLKMLTKGEPVQQVRIRKGDFLVDLEASFNEFLASPYNPSRLMQKQEDAAQSDSPSPREIVEQEANLFHEVQDLQFALWKQSDGGQSASAPQPEAKPAAVQEQSHQAAV